MTVNSDKYLCLFKGETVSTPLDKDGIGLRIYEIFTNGRGTTLQRERSAIYFTFLKYNFVIRMFLII